LTVYVEYVFINNLAVNLVICLLVYKMQKIKLSPLRLSIASVLGAIIALLYPLIEKYDLLVRIALSLLMVGVLIKYTSVWQYLTSLALFYLVTFCFAGAVLMLSSGDYLDKGMIEFVPALIAAGIFAAFILINFITKEIYTIRRRRLLEYQVELSTEYGRCSAKAYYDSGNGIYDKENQPVIIISDKVYDLLKGGEEDMLGISTLSGEDLIKIIKVRLKIYMEKDANRIFNINAGVSTKLNNNYDVILHVDLIGG
jgi:stage II sporulation protein GA (sporulation sigma-E factor processing peptidase)